MKCAHLALSYVVYPSNILSMWQQYFGIEAGLLTLAGAQLLLHGFFMA